MKYLRVRNWDKFQHYKKDEPAAWIKLHTKLLSDYEFNLLSFSEQAKVFRIWLLAARMGNKLPHDQAWIKNQISARTLDLEGLISRGILEDFYTEPRPTLVSEEKRREEKKGTGAKAPVDKSKKPDVVKGSWCETCRTRLAPGVYLEDHQRISHAA